VQKIDIAYTSRLIPTKSRELIEMQQYCKHQNKNTRTTYCIKGQGLEIFGCLNYPSTPWWDFAIVQELIATTKGKVFDVKEF
jgi:hypothetical protein